MFGRNKKRLDEENNELNRRHLRNMAVELYRTCWELGCGNCQYNNYDGKGHCKSSAFDKSDVEYRPRDWRWIEEELNQ